MAKCITETESLLIICIGAAYLVRCSSSAYFALLLPSPLPHSLEYFMRCRCHYTMATARTEIESEREKWAIKSMRNTIQFRIWCTADTLKHRRNDDVNSDSWIDGNIVRCGFFVTRSQSKWAVKKSIEIIFTRKLKEAFPATAIESVGLCEHHSTHTEREKKLKLFKSPLRNRYELYFWHFRCDGDSPTETWNQWRETYDWFFIVIRHSRGESTVNGGRSHRAIITKNELFCTSYRFSFSK